MKIGDMMSLERLYELLLCNKPSGPLSYNEKELFDLIPELESCKGFDQKNTEWHIYDVYEHTLHVIDYTPCNLVLRLTALFHDLGKPKTLKIDEKGIGHFKGHWVVSQTIFDKFADKYNIDSDIKDMVSKLIYYHDIRVEQVKDEQVLIDMCEILGREGIRLLYAIKRADLLAHNPDKYYLLTDYNIQENILLEKYFEKSQIK